MSASRSISDLAAEFAVTARTLRFYEEEGLLSPKRVGGRRVFSAQDRARLAVILRGRGLGIPLAEIRRYLDAHTAAGADADSVRADLDARIRALEGQRTDIEVTLRELRAVAARLQGGLRGSDEGR